jgi:hypothetical protein
MFGDKEATVLDSRTFDLHGMTYHDVTVRFSDGSVEQARLGAESVPDGIRPGERVIASRVANMIVSLSRP